MYPLGDCFTGNNPTTFNNKNERIHTTINDNVNELKYPEAFVDDPISEILRNGARKLLAEAS